MFSKKSVNYVVTAAITAAVYIALTLTFAPISYGAVQFRISEVLTVLCFFTPAAVPGLTVGCFISNIFSFNPIDMIFGTFATFISAFVSYKIRNIKMFKLPIAGMITPVIVNAVIIGAEIAVYMPQSSGVFTAFLLSALSVGAGEAVICLGLGIPLYFALKDKSDIFMY